MYAFHHVMQNVFCECVFFDFEMRTRQQIVRFRQIINTFDQYEFHDFVYCIQQNYRSI